MTDDTLQMSFQQAIEDVKTLTRRPSNDVLLKLYSLYKQASEGDVKGARPGMLNQVARAKYDAWKSLKGFLPDDAKQAYIDQVQMLKAPQ